MLIKNQKTLVEIVTALAIGGYAVATNHPIANTLWGMLILLPVASIMAGALYTYIMGYVYFSRLTENINDYQVGIYYVHGMIKNKPLFKPSYITFIRLVADVKEKFPNFTSQDAGAIIISTLLRVRGCRSISDGVKIVQDELDQTIHAINHCTHV